MSKFLPLRTGMHRHPLGRMLGYVVLLQLTVAAAIIKLS